MCIKFESRKICVLLSTLHVHSWHSDLSLRLWGPWSLNVLTIAFVFLWVRGPAHYENTQCYFSVGLPRIVCAFVSLTLDDILQQYVPRNTVAKFYPNCFLPLLWTISDQMISLDYYHPWSATNSARSFTFQPVSFGQWNVVVKLTTFLAPYEHVLITCCLSFQVFRGSVFCMCQHGDANSSPNWKY